MPAPLRPDVINAARTAKRLALSLIIYPLIAVSAIPFIRMEARLKQHYRHLESVFAKAKINLLYYASAVLKVDDGTSAITLEAGPAYHHGMGAVHGSVYFKMLDDAAYFAANSRVTDFFLVTTGFHIHMLRPVGSGTLRAEGRLKLRSPSLLIADAVLFNDAGKEIACGTGHFAKSKFPVNPLR